MSQVLPALVFTHAAALMISPFATCWRKMPSPLAVALTPPKLF
jgi:hypothetical protein